MNRVKPHPTPNSTAWAMGLTDGKTPFDPFDPRLGMTCPSSMPAMPFSDWVPPGLRLAPEPMSAMSGQGFIPPESRGAEWRRQPAPDLSLAPPWLGKMIGWWLFWLIAAVILAALYSADTSLPLI